MRNDVMGYINLVIRRAHLGILEMKRTIPVPTNCITSDVLINPWCTCVVTMAHGIHARNNSAMCTPGTPPGCVNSRYLWELTNNQTHIRTQPAIPKNWRVSVDVTTWFRGSRPHETVAGIQFVSWWQHKVPVRTRENTIIKNRSARCLGCLSRYSYCG